MRRFCSFARPLVTAVVIVCLAGAACRRERREVVPLNGQAERPDAVRLTPLQPGKPRPPRPTNRAYADNAYAMSEGKRLYSAFNCNGCHANGGGGIGPALMDDEWIYGSDPDQVYSTIVQGRPDGMPSFGGRIPEQEVWQIVAYVESLSGNAVKTAATGRPDDLAAKRPEARVEPATPRQTGHR
jgi:cytochrome c oxidase cbb3-type subunit 3